MNKLIYGMKDSNRYIYHYTTMDVAINHILPTNTLKANNYSSTNDPKESKQWQFDLGTNENRDMGQYDMAALSIKLSDALKSKTKLVCFSKDETVLTGNHLNDIFKRGFCKPRMWAQYAGNHSGVCLVFDRHKLDTAISGQINKRHLTLKGDVNYRDRGVVGRLDEGEYKINVDYLEKLGFDQYVSAHFQTFYQRLFFEKMNDWVHESEFRWVISTDHDGPIMIDYQNALAGIVFGDSAIEDDVDKIIDMTDYKILYTGLKWKNCSPWYDLANFKYDKALRDSPWYKEKS